jgi:hypothetical protein
MSICRPAMVGNNKPDRLQRKRCGNADRDLREDQ